MKVACPSCSSGLNIDDKKIPAAGARIKCPQCQTIFPVKPPADAGGAVPLPGATTTHAPPSNIGGNSPNIPLPGHSAAHVGDGPSFNDATTQVGSFPPAPIPLPKPISAPRSSGAGPSIPLPGSSAFASGPSMEAPAIPLPGSGYAAAPPSFESASIPLPGQGYAPTASAASIPLPGSGAYAAPAAVQTAAIPLPSGQSHSANSFVGHAAPQESIPLPGSGAEHVNYMGEAPAADDAVPEASDFDVAELPDYAPAPPDTTTYDNLPAPKGAAPSEFDLETSAPPAPSVDYSNLPSPAMSDLPMPAMRDLPSPAAPKDDLAFDFSELPPPPGAASASNPRAFGEVDLGGSDALEFDPGQAGKSDDFEADLSAPIPAPAGPQGPSDGLEMLSFIDEGAQEAGVTASHHAGRRFHIKRRSGKVFGPFEEQVVIKMLEEGQLLGNEEVSLDGEGWHPIGTEAAFQDAIVKLMEQPQAMGVGPAPESTVSPGHQVASMERLKQVYEGRMAAVAVVEGKEPVSLRRFLPLAIIGAVLLAILGVGAYLGTTPYGFFALKLLFPAKVKAGTKEFAELQRAQQALLTDTFKSYQEARDAAAATLKIKEYPQARAAWCQAIFHLKRRYGAASPADVATATAELANIELLGAKNPEVVKAQAGAALSTQNADQALSQLNDALARVDNQDDVELQLLRAEAYLAKNQLPQAKSELEAVLKKKPGLSRALHMLGNLYQAQREADKAVEKYEEALKADPEHVSSAVELAAIELLIRKDMKKGLGAVSQALSPERADKLGPAEKAKALGLRAEALAMDHQNEKAITAFEEALKIDPDNAFAKSRLAFVYQTLHQHDKALPLFKIAAEANPENLEYVEGYLSTLIALGKMTDAMKVVEQANKRFKANAHLAYLSGRVADALDQSKEAEASYKSAISADPNLIDASLHLARLYLRFRRIQEAKPLLATALKSMPDSPELNAGQGEVALSDHDYEAAQAAFKKAVELNPALAAGYLGLSRVAVASEKFEDAEAMIEKALELDAAVPGGRQQRGICLWKLGRFEEAVAELEKARAEDPRNVQVIVSLGAVQMAKGDLTAATTTLLAALQTDPSSPDANFYLARVKNLRLEHTQAIEYMKKAIDHAPKRPELHYWMGKLYRDAKKQPEALEEWRAALDLDPKNADSLEALGQAFLDKNDSKNAVSYFQRTLEADPKRVAIWESIGDAQRVAEDWDSAIKSYNKALSANVESKSLYFKLGETWGEKKKWTDAVNWYKKATQVDPDNAMAWLNLGWAAKEKKNKPEAIAAFRKYLEKKPDADDKKEIEDQIDYLKQER